MDIEYDTRKEKMLKLREELLAVEEDRNVLRKGKTVEVLDEELTNFIEELQ